MERRIHRYSFPIPGVVEMIFAHKRWVLMSCVLAWTVQVAFAQEPNGRALFTSKCATCHTANPDSANRAPAPEALRARSPESIIDALTGLSLIHISSPRDS